MIAAPVYTPSSSLVSEVSAVDRTARFPLLMLIGSALVWLVVGTFLALIPNFQLISPQFLADIPLLTHGRVEALQESALIYGWAANAGLAVVLWILARLGNAPLRAANWIFMGGLFWNLGLTVGLIGIAFGDATSITWLELPGYVQPLMLVSYGAMAVGGVLAWTGRARQVTFASQWYAVAALFLFPWLLSVAQVMLLWAPARGVLQAVVANWYMQGAWSLWLVPLALATAYYIVPKITGRLLASYEFAPLGFWTLIVIGAWTGGRHLVGGPVPAWISSAAIGACSLLLFHYFVVAINLGAVWRKGSIVLTFIAFGMGCYLLNGLGDAVTSIRGIAKVIEFTYFVRAQSEFNFYGVAAMIFSAGIYYMLPRVTGRHWASAGLIRMHFILFFVGVVVLVANLAVAGIKQGYDLDDASVPFSAIAEHTRAYLIGALVARVLLFLGSLGFALNFIRTLLVGERIAPEAWQSNRVVASEVVS